MPPNKPLSVSGAEVVLLALLIIFGMALGVWVERGFEWFCQCEPNEARTLQQRGITEKQEHLVRLQEATKQADAQLLGAQLDAIKQDAALKTLQTMYPGIVKPNPTSVSPETQKTYEAAKNQRAVDAQLVETMTAHVDSLRNQTKSAAGKVESETEAATHDVQKAKAKYALARSAVAFVLPILLVLFALSVVRAVLTRRMNRPVWTNQGWLPYLIVAGALTILLAYQALQVAGAIIVAIILFLFVLWKINWSGRVGKPPLAHTQE